MPDKYFTVESNRISMDGGGMFGHAPKGIWGKWLPCDEHNLIRLATRCLVVQADGLTILFEAGTGAYMDPKFAERYCIDTSEHKLLANLAGHNINESDVDYIILSHLHFDHVGGILPQWPGMQDSNWELLFPNAKYVVGRGQFERSLQPHSRDRASYIKGLGEKLEATGRLVLVDENNPSVPELEGLVSLEVSNGHTPDLLNSLVRIDGKTLYYASDLIPGAPWVHLPITTGFDRNPELLVNEKKHVLDRAVREDWIIIFMHDPDVSAAHIIFDEEKGKYLPVPVNI